MLLVLSGNDEEGVGRGTCSFIYHFHHHCYKQKCEYEQMQ